MTKTPNEMTLEEFLNLPPEQVKKWADSELFVFEYNGETND